jgi:hypothetical protein
VGVEVGLLVLSCWVRLWAQVPLGTSSGEDSAMPECLCWPDCCTIRRQIGLGSGRSLWVHHGLVLNRGQTPERSLSSASVVGPFDPGHDRGAEVLPSHPGAAVEDVLRNSAKNDSMAALSPQAPTLPIDPTIS